MGLFAMKPKGEAAHFVSYITLPICLKVRFATAPGRLRTWEGAVPFEIGDAIVTGLQGEQWPIPAASFAGKYQPAPGNRPGHDGDFVKRAAIVKAQKQDARFSIDLPGGRAPLYGNAGDWKVRYGDDGESIVAAGIFEASYELARVPLRFAADATLAGDARAAACLSAIEIVLRSALNETPVRWLRGAEAEDEPPWFVVTREAPAATAPLTRTMTLALSALCGANDAAPDELAAAIARARGRFERRRIAFSGHKLATQTRKLMALICSLLRRPDAVDVDEETEEPSPIDILAAQLVALDKFNESIAQMDRRGEDDKDLQSKDGPFVAMWLPVDLSSPLQRFHRIGVLADLRASQWQDKWQALVFGTTKHLVDRSDVDEPLPAGDTTPAHHHLGWREPEKLRRTRNADSRLLCRLLGAASLVTLGLTAAISLAAFTEIAEGCEKEPPFHFLGCGSPLWERYAGPVLLGVYVIALTWAWIRFARAQIDRTKDRHQDCRLLAEGMRVQYVASVCGDTHPVSDAIPTAAHATSGWVLNALRALTYRYAMRPHAAALPDRLRWARIHFVREQILYHRKTLIGRRQLALVRFARLGSVGALVFLLMLAVVVIDQVLVVASLPHLPEFARHLLIIAMAAGLAGWAAMRRVPEAFGWEAEAQRGTLVLNALREAEQVFADPANGVAEHAAALQSCGRFFVADQAAWHALHRAKPIEAASGG